MPKPLIAVVGTTGVGKTALALELAKKFNGELINSDSMQVYQNLAIVTNKPTPSELATAKHHLFDFVGCSVEYSVLDYTKAAVDTAQKLSSENIQPIVVGGTNYYLQSLLWTQKIIETAKIAPSPNTTTSNGLAEKPKARDSAHPSLPSEIKQSLQNILEKTDPRTNTPNQIKSFYEKTNVHNTLKSIDLKMGNRWHPKDFRKIRRSLEIYYTTGLKQSEIIETQSKSELRYKTLVFWVYAPPKDLNPRLDQRVENMIERGMFDEIEFMLGEIARGGVVGENDYTRGILQAIGFKEFKKYFDLKKQKAELDLKDFDLKKQKPERDFVGKSVDLDLQRENVDLDLQRENRNRVSEEEVEEALREGVELMKIATRQYAKRQTTWIKNKLCPDMIQCHQNNEGGFYLIDCSDKDAMKTQLARIIELADDFINGAPNKPSGILANELGYLLEKREKVDMSEQFVCDVCVYKNGGKKVLNGREEFDKHLNSNNHKIVVQRIKKIQEREDYLAQKAQNE
jgi:tRNA dimethylallyltransferase